MSNRMRHGIVTRFNPRTWWGRIRLDEGRVFDFHATCYRGMRTGMKIAKHQRVSVIFSDETCARMLAVEAC